MVDLVVVAEIVRFEADTVGLHGGTFRRGVSVGTVQFTGDVLDLIAGLRFIEVG